MNPPVQKYLTNLAEDYCKKKSEFFELQEKLKSHFDIDAEDKNQLAFGLTPANPDYKEYAELINSNKELIKLSGEMKELLLSGHLYIIRSIIKEGNSINFDIQNFVVSPDSNFNKIEYLILSLAGYRHTYISEKGIVSKKPVRDYLLKYPHIIQMVDYWVLKLGVFYIEPYEKK